eukprot:scaffold126292_cov63-Phaeocystis_antarctica.AAC.1
MARTARSNGISRRSGPTLLLGMFMLSPTVLAQTTVAVYAQSSLDGATGCDNEIQNLMSIVSHVATADSGKGAGTYTIGTTDYDFSAFVVDDSIRAFNQSDLETKLATASFFFMVDMEGSLIGWDATSQGIVKAYVENGGVLFMTGTYGSKDADFLNAAFGWDTSSTHCSGSTAAKNAEGAKGTPFELDGSSSISTTMSATDCLNCGTASCTPLYGTADNAMVVEFEVGRGKVIYVGWDYWNAGMVATIPDGQTGGGRDSPTRALLRKDLGGATVAALAALAALALAAAVTATVTATALAVALAPSVASAAISAAIAALAAHPAALTATTLAAS